MDVGLSRQEILGRGNDQVPFIQRRPGAPEMDQAGAPARALPDPAGHRLVATPGGDNQVRPGGFQGAGGGAVDTGQAGAGPQMYQQLPGAGVDMLFLEVVTQLLGQGPYLGIIACFPAQQTPDQGLTLAHFLSKILPNPVVYLLLRQR